MSTEASVEIAGNREVESPTGHCLHPSQVGRTAGGYRAGTVRRSRLGSGALTSADSDRQL